MAKKEQQDLTSEQKAELTEYCTRWTGHAMSTEPADWERAEKGIVLAYRAAGLKAPTRFLHFSSPLSGAIAAMRLAAATETNWKAVYGKLKKTTSEELVKWFHDNKATAAAEVDKWLGNAMYGQQYAGWCAFYEFFWKVMGVEECAKIEGLIELAQSCGWCWPFEHVAILTDKPTTIKLNAENRPHCDDGPALAYRDGHKVYALNRIRVTQQIVEAPHTLTPTQIDNEPNAEVRRLMIERFGIERYILEGDSKVVAQDEWGTLYKKSRPGDTDLQMIKVVNSTPEADGTFKDYFLRVPPTMTTPREALAWTFGKPAAEDYSPVKET